MKKLKVIVIDDEMLIRKLIRMKMDTKRLNLEVAGEYANGAAAFIASSTVLFSFPNSIKSARSFKCRLYRYPLR